MNTKVILLVGMLATATIAFGGVFSETAEDQTEPTSRAAEPQCMPVEPWWQVCQAVVGVVCTVPTSLLCD